MLYICISTSPKKTYFLFYHAYSKLIDWNVTRIFGIYTFHHIHCYPLVSRIPDFTFLWFLLLLGIKASWVPDSTINIFHIIINILFYKLKIWRIYIYILYPIKLCVFRNRSIVIWSLLPHLVKWLVIDETTSR